MRVSSARIVRGSEPGPLPSHLKALREDASEEANEDVGPAAVCALMPDRAGVQLILPNAEGCFGLGELDIRVPEAPTTPIEDTGLLRH